MPQRPRQSAPVQSASASCRVLSRHLAHHSHCRPPSAPPKTPADCRQPLIYPNSSPDHTRLLLPLPPSSVLTPSIPVLRWIRANAVRPCHAKLEVYPRVCGGTRVSASICAVLTGLSPRLRGNHLESRRGNSCLGSIPASAGEPSTAGGAYATSEVYPRVCGGTAASVAQTAAVEGLSPRLRGNLDECLSDYYGVGSIPASAGEPRSRCRGIPRTGVYPRVCGGTAQGPIPLGYQWGLSPRLRGNQGIGDRPAAICRSIPASAGEPERGRRYESG